MKGLEMTEKKKLTDRRVLLSNRYIESLKPKERRYSVGDSEVIGLRIFVFEGGQKTFYYSYTAKNKDQGLEKLGFFGSVNVKEAFCFITNPEPRSLKVFSFYSMNFF